ncbi:MAG: hypothetical protein QOJ30_2456 [Pseudonocardiales bacterium]|jgi:CBS domain-containing protein|nr:hypothetical protein [Pseudonocardiales bacterium]
MKVRDAMSGSVDTVRADTPIPVAASMLHRHGTVPVVDGQGHLVGVAAEADLARGVLAPEGWQVELDPESIVAAVTKLAPVVARPEDDVADVVASMLDRGVRSVPVVDGERVVGVLTRHEVLLLVARRELMSEQAWRERTCVVGQDQGVRPAGP